MVLYALVLINMNKTGALPDSGQVWKGPSSQAVFVRRQTANEETWVLQLRQQLYGKTTGRGESRAGLWPSGRYTRIMEEGARDVVPLQEVLPRRALKAAPE